MNSQLKVIKFTLWNCKPNRCIDNRKSGRNSKNLSKSCLLYVMLISKFVTFWQNFFNVKPYIVAYFKKVEP